ncbi:MULTISPECIES: glycosyltransferase [unclassified Staphylococcus]|uniref:glycosyltransferase n=1 Tax=unclassified Staphylococcus TaxID=91994 RepID=UPI0021D0D601|nr:MULTISPECIES: glycosyltransferase [unclassified Staphylococcus]UXR78202.1 CDP-glycerol glycerophosphotransferase family protein [Staphylococcus sp. IVB6227]UXR82365.1 CDP-glycerol glycerophosphotransferase family protein [Staphylococcus sp. IVB6214]
MNKVKEIKDFLLNPVKENLKNKRVRDNAFYINTIRTSPVKKNAILFESYHGVNFTGNVYAIFRKMVDVYPNMKFYIAIKDTNDPMIKWIKKTLDNKNIFVVKYESREYLRLLATCKYLINDTSFMPYFIKRDNQVYVNTWHGTPLKTLGIDIKDRGFNDHKNIQKNLFSADKLILPNKFTADKLIKSHDLEGILNAEVGIYGNPRVDLTLNSNREDVINKYGLNQSKKILLYAPTWKKTLKDTTDEDIQNLVDEVILLQEKMGGDYKVYLKAHYFIYEKFKELGLDSLMVPNWVDTNELLCAVDTLITDYSSLFFDYLPLQRPIYFYMPDKEEYEETRGFYLDIEGLPGSKAYTLNELMDNIDKYQDEYTKIFKSEINRYLEDFCLFDNGITAGQSLDFIIGKRKELTRYKSNKKVIVFYGGGFYNNGITNSIINLSKKIDYDKYEVILIENDKKFDDKINNMNRLDQRVHVISRFSRTNRNVIDTITQNLLYRQGYDSKYIYKKMMKAYFKLDYKRIFGNLNPDIMIDYGGYNKMFTALFAFAPVKRKAIFLHNDMQGEYDKVINGRYKHRWNLKVIFSLYDHFDKIVSVTESANEANKKNLAKYITHPESKMVSISNIINGDEIIEMATSEDHSHYFDKENRKNYLIFKKNIEDSQVAIKAVEMPDSNYHNFVNVARLSPEKNHEELIKAFVKVVQRHSNSRLYIIGDGPLKRELKQLIARLGMQNHIFLLGFIENPFIFINKCDCFVLPSNYEGQGMVVLEAQVLGIPVIGTNVPGINSIINEKNGLLIEKNVESIADGMNQFIEKGIVKPYFDYQKYNEKVIDDFKKYVLE